VVRSVHRAPQITVFGILYALHDGPVRSLPGQKIGASLAESWSESPDGLVYEFKLRRGLKFHNGDPLTTEDVKFSFERYKGAGAREMHDAGAPGRDRRSARHPLSPQGALARLHDVLRHHRHRRRAGRAQEVHDQVGEEGFRKHPIGAGPYKFVSDTPESRWCWRPIPRTGARCPTSSGW
jgi:peptide/nickel transport system substrate-binding protein